MKKMSITFDIFSFDELSEKSREVAIKNEIRFMLEVVYDPDKPNPPGLKKAVEKADQMQTPWFTGSYVWDYCKDYILQGLRDPDVFYLKSGALALCNGESMLNMEGEISFPEGVQP